MGSISRGIGGARAGGSSSRGTVVRARYGASAGKTSAAVNYYTQRPDDEHIQQEERQGFSKGQEELSREEMYILAKQQDEQKSYGYEMVLSPPPENSKDMSNEELQSWSKGVMMDLEARHGEDMKWIAVVHEHKEHPHVHVMAWTNEKLDRADLNAIRESANRSLEQGYSYRSELKPEHSFSHSVKAEKEQGQTVVSGGVKSSGNEKDIAEENKAVARRERGHGAGIE